MKFVILVLPVLLLSACDKAEEKSATPVKPAGGDSKRLVPESARRTAVTAGETITTPQVAAISEGEIQTFTGKADELARRWDEFLKLPQDQQTGEALKSIQAEHQALVAERGRILKGLTTEQRKAHIRSLIGSVSKVGSGILTYGLTKRKGSLMPSGNQPAAIPDASPPQAPAPPNPVQDTAVPEDGQPVPEPDNGGGVPDNPP